MGYRTDLAIENVEIDNNNRLKGVEHFVQIKGQVQISTVKIISQQGEKAIGKPQGTYITMDCASLSGNILNFAQEVEVVAEELKALLPQNTKSALIVGLGNSNITPDALGPQTIENIFVTRHIPKSLAKQIGLSDLVEVSAVATGVLGQTGIESAQIIQSICKDIKPDVVIVIDALAAKNISRLGSTVQLANSGISPGSGVLNHRKEISKQNLGVNVISMGVPMVVDLNSVVKVDAQQENMMVTPRSIDAIIEHSAKTIGYAINRALHPSLNIEEITGLVN